MAGINEKNYKYLAESIKAAIEQAKWLIVYVWAYYFHIYDFCGINCWTGKFWEFIKVD